MTIEFARTTVISRGDGHSAIKAAAYRAGEKLHDERLGRVSDYSHRNEEVECSEILLPEGADQAYLDRQTLWTAVEDREDQHNRRASAQLAKDHVIALPKELNKEQQIELARGFAQQEFVSRGLVVDLNIHYHSDGNPHAHLLTTTRALDGKSFGLKDRDANGPFYCNGAKMVDAEQLRHRWSNYQNEYFRKNEIDLNVLNNDGDLEPVKQLKRSENLENSTQENADQGIVLTGRAAALLESPEIIIQRVADRKSLFTRHDLYRELHNLVDDKDTFSLIKERLENHSDLISVGVSAGKKELFTSINVVETEKRIGEIGAQLVTKNDDFAVHENHVKAALLKRSFLSDEQKLAVRHTLEANRMASVVGLAGAGKSTMLLAMREASESAGHRVFGVALAGKAAEELSKSSGIESRTIASFLIAKKNKKLDLLPGDIVVMDEAGMVNNKTMMDVMEVINRSGAKLVLVGDGEQLQPIQAGSPFKQLTEKFGSANIETIRRQNTDWQKNATYNLAKSRGSEALEAYKEAGFVHSLSKNDAVDKLINDYTEDRENGVSQAILAHKNADVKQLNLMIRDTLKSAGRLENGRIFKAGQTATNAGIPPGTRIGDTIVFEKSNVAMGYNAADRATYMGEQQGMHTLNLDNGAKLSFGAESAPMLRLEEEQTTSDLELSVGDRILFTKNDGFLGVKNGMLGTLVSYEADRVIVALDDGGTVDFSVDEYSNIDHGYATTIHKSQGMTVDKAYLLGSNTMDKHLGYVGMSRHRDTLNVYLPQEEFEKTDFGSLLSKINHQDSVLDLAEKHGLSYDQSDIGKTEFYSPNPSVEGEVTMNAAVAASTEDALTINEAQQTLESTRLSLIDKMNNDAELGIKEAERSARITERALDNHRQEEPRQGLFAGKAKHQEWSDKLESLERESVSARKTVSNLKTQLDSSQEKFSREARMEAARRHPAEADLVKTHKSQERSADLLNRIKTIEKDIDELDGGDRRASRLDTLHRKLDRALKDLSADPKVQEKLTPDQAKSIKQAVTKLEQGKRVREIEEMSRGGHEL